MTPINWMWIRYPSDADCDKPAKYALIKTHTGAKPLALVKSDEDAALIVAAVNSFDEAKAALEQAGTVLDSMLNGQGLEADNMDTALLAIHKALATMNGGAK